MTVDDITDETIVYASEQAEVISTGALEQIKSETKVDETLQLMQETHRHGWPDTGNRKLAHQTHSGSEKGDNVCRRG